jgi:PAS domain S-box-containing protein
MDQRKTEDQKHWPGRDLSGHQPGQGEQYLSSIFNMAGDVLFVLSVEKGGNFRFDIINEAFVRVTGLKREQIVGKLVSEVIPEPSLSMVLGNYREAIYGNKIVKWEEVTDYPSGKLTGEVKIAPVFNQEGICTHLVGSVHDLTERKRSENALKESEELYRNLVENIPDGLYKSTHDGKFVKVNPALVKMLGYDSEEELLAIDIKSQLYFDLSDRESNVLDEHQEEIGVFPLRKKDGTALWVEDHGWYNLDERGEILFHEGIIRDISERIQAEEKRKQSELEYKTLFENANDAIMIMNQEKFTECNLMTLKMYGCKSKEDIVYHFPWEFSPEFQPDGQRSSDKARGLIEMAMTGEPQRFYWKHCRMDGTLFDADVSLNRIDFVSNFRIQAIVRDITRQKNDELEKARLNAELKELNATKDRFFSIVAHDLRSPFNALLGLTQVISNPDEGLSLEETRTISGRVHGLLLNQFNFLQNLLEWSRIQQGRYAFHPEEINLAELATIVIDLLSGNIVKKQIEVADRIKDPCMIEGDCEMIKSVLLNLVSNAIKFTPRNGRIELEAVTRGGKVEILIRDSGVGIKEDQIGKLFRLDTVSTTTGTEGEKGTGLGLILCREMVKKHDGTIEIFSQPDKGTTVLLSIPVRRPGSS